MTSSELSTLPHTNKSGNGSPKPREKTIGVSSTISVKLDNRARQQGLPSGDAGLILMSPEALTNNERLFPTFKVHLADVRPSGNYETSSEKLAGWLSKDKAYYPSARPWIIALMEQAQHTVRQVGATVLPMDKPFHVSQCTGELEHWVKPYIKLIRTVRPFDHFFIEPELRVRLQALLDTVEAPKTQTFGPLATPLPSQSRSDSVPSTVSPSPLTGFANSDSTSSNTSSLVLNVTPPSVIMPVAPTVITDLPRATSPVSMAPVNDMESAQQPLSRPGGSHSISNAEGVAPSTLTVISQPNVESAQPSVRHNFPAIPSASPAHAIAPSTQTAAPGPDLNQMSSDFAKKDAQWIAKRSRPSVDNIVQSKTTSATLPPTINTSSSAPLTWNGSVSAPVRKKAKPKGSSLLSKGFLEDDVEWYRQQQKAKSEAAKVVKVQAEGQSSDVPTAENTSAKMTEAATVQSEVEKTTGPASGQRDVSAKDDVGSKQEARVIEIRTDVRDVEMADVASNVEDKQSPGQVLADVPLEHREAAKEEHKLSKGVIRVKSPPHEEPIPHSNTSMIENLQSEDRAEDQTVAAPAPLSRSHSPSPAPNAVSDVVLGAVPHTTPDDVVPDVVPGAVSDDISDHPQSPTSMLMPTAPSKAHSETRQLDLSKMRTPLKHKSKKPSDFVISKVVHTPSALESTTAVSSTSAYEQTVSPQVSASEEDTPAHTALSSLPPNHSPSHRVKAKKKGPPGIKASEFSPSSSAESTGHVSRPVLKSKRGPPGIKVLPLQTTTQQPPAEAPTTSAQLVSDSPTVSEEQTKPESQTRAQVAPVVSSAECAHDSLLPNENVTQDGTTLIPVVSSKADGEAEVAEEAIVSSSETVALDSTMEVGMPYPPAATSSEAIDKAGYLGGALETPKPPTLRGMKVGEDESDGDEPLATKNRRASEQGPPRSLKRGRSRSTSVPPSNQRRKVIPGYIPSSPTPVGSSSKLPHKEPQYIHSTPREYSAAAFDSGNYVYSPVQTHFDREQYLEPSSVVTTVPAEQLAITRPNTSAVPARQTSAFKATAKASRTHSRVSWQSTGIIIPTNEELAQLSLFTDDSVVLGFHRGHAVGIPDTISFSFHLDDAVFDALTLWHTRHDHMKDISITKCLSLMCYKFSECAESLPHGAENMNAKEVFLSKPVEWPYSAYLDVHVNKNLNLHQHFRVSSWHTDADHIIDISRRVQRGPNTLDLVRGWPHASTLDYIFVLRLHAPTPRQAAEIMKRRAGDIAWITFLRGCGTIEIPAFEYTKTDILV